MAPDLFQYHDHFTFLATIGETKSSQVFKVAHRQSGEVFAVKRSRKRFRSKLQRERCLREVQMVASLPEMENIVAQYRAWQEGGHFYIQMDYCDGGSLHQYLDRQDGGRLVHGSGECSALWIVARDVSAGLKFLHSNNVLHLDIKPENIYTKQDTSVWKIGDFGLAIGKETTDWEEGDGDYVAPELLRAASEQPRPAADIFSLGATLYQCATGRKLPRCVGSPDADISGLLEERGSAGGATVDDDLRTLLQAMTLPDPRMRPSASQVLVYAEAMLRADAARPSLEAVPVDGNLEADQVDGRAPAFGQSTFDDVDDVEHVDDVDGVDGVEDLDVVVGMNDVDMSRSFGPNDLCHEPATSADRLRNPPKPSNTSTFPPKLPLLNLKNKTTNATNGGLSSASNSFRIMRRDTARDSDSEYGSYCDTERTMTTTTDMCDVQCQDDLNDLVSPRRDGGLFGPLSSRLLRGHGGLTFDMASPDVHISDGADGSTGLTGCNGCSGCDACGPSTTAKQEAIKPNKGHKSQSRTGYLQGRRVPGDEEKNDKKDENDEHNKNKKKDETADRKQDKEIIPHQQPGAGAKSNRIGLIVWNEFEEGEGGGNVTKRYRSPFADGSEHPPMANHPAMERTDKENVAAMTATSTEKARTKLTTTTTTKPAGKKRVTPVPLLPIQSNRLASKQTFGKKRQHSHRNSSRSGRSSHRSGTNDVNLSARSLDVLMPPKKRAEYEHAGVSIESLHGELSARMKI